MKMNKENILNEGILEAYLVGDLSRDQENEVFEILQSNQDLMVQFKELESNMEKLAFENAVEPPSHVKQNILSQLHDTSSTEVTSTKTIEFNKYKRYLSIAASIAVLFMTASIVLWFNMNEAQKELKSTLSKQDSLLDSILVITKNVVEKEQLIAYVNHPKTEKYILKGNALAPNASVSSFVNHEQESVIVSIQKLPKLKDKDYQMWADVDGKMINMGILDSNKKMVKMNYIKNAESINITVEKKGGSDHPDVSQLIGSVSI